MLIRLAIMALFASCGARATPPVQPVVPEPAAPGGRAARSTARTNDGAIVGQVKTDAPAGFFLDAPASLSARAPATGVAVIATSPALGRPRRTVTDEHGAYRIEDLPPGTYRLVFQRPGTPEVERDAIEIRTGRITPVFVILPPATKVAPSTTRPLCVHFETCWL